MHRLPKLLARADSRTAELGSNAAGTNNKSGTSKNSSYSGYRKGELTTIALTFFRQSRNHLCVGIILFSSLVTRKGSLVHFYFLVHFLHAAREEKLGDIEEFESFGLGAGGKCKSNNTIVIRVGFN